MPKHRRRLFAEERLGAQHQPFGRGPEVGMPRRVHRPLLEGDGQLDEELRRHPRECRLQGSLRLRPLGGRGEIGESGMGHLASTGILVMTDGNSHCSAKGAPSGTHVVRYCRIRACNHYCRRWRCCAQLIPPFWAISARRPPPKNEHPGGVLPGVFGGLHGRSVVLVRGEPRRDVEVPRVELVDPVPGKPARGREVRRRVAHGARVVRVALDVSLSARQADCATLLLDDAAREVEAAAPGSGAVAGLIGARAGRVTSRRRRCRARGPRRGCPPRSSQS